MPNIRQALLVGAPAEKVYGAITSQEGLSAWWTPEAEARPERGTVARLLFGPDYFKEMRITALTPSKQVEWTCIAGADEWIGTTISFTLEAGERDKLLKAHPEMSDQVGQMRSSDGGTLLVLQHDGWRGYTPMFAECSYTWGQFLRSLKLFCETGKGRPWPHQHRGEP